MSTQTIEVKLSFPEIILLDGKCRPEIQSKVEEAKTATAIMQGTTLSESEAQMVAKIVATAINKGKLDGYADNARECPCCGRSEGYWPVARTTKYKRRGELDYDNPKLIRVYDLDRSCIRHRVWTGYCDSCKDRVLPVLRERLEGIRAEIPERVMGVPPKYKRYDNRKCKACGWEGHEGQMGKLRTLMGDGHYPGKCPKCGAENILFRTQIESAPGFVVVEA